MEAEKLIQELKFRTSRSSGAGGQHVNKVETKVELLFNLEESNALSKEEKDNARKRLAKKINKAGILILSSQKTRSQLANKEIVIEEFLKLMERAVKPPKKRKKVKPLTADREKRLSKKKRQSEKKAARKKVDASFKGE